MMDNKYSSLTRRDFIGGFAAAAGVAFSGCCGASQCCSGGGRMLFGICVGNDLKTVGEMKELGYDFFEGTVASTLMPTKKGDEWKRQKDAILAAPLPLRCCNGFLPGTFRLTGPKAAWDEPLAYAEKVCSHADEVNMDYIVFGSGGARQVPRTDKKIPASPEAIKRGLEQFAEFCEKLAARIAGCKVTIVLEPLRPKECNLLNYVWEGLEIVKRINSPRIQQLADLFHMAEGKESPDSIVKAGTLLKHCHVATPGGRKAPGLEEPGVLLDYFKALRGIGYKGGVSCECSWGPKGKDKREVRANALALMKKWSGQT